VVVSHVTIHLSLDVLTTDLEKLHNALVDYRGPTARGLALAVFNIGGAGASYNIFYPFMLDTADGKQLCEYQVAFLAAIADLKAGSAATE
jgi:hypothetical protein